MFIHRPSERYHLRNTSHLQLPQCCSSQSQAFISFAGVQAWNSLPESLRLETRTDQFKHLKNTYYHAISTAQAKCSARRSCIQNGSAMQLDILLMNNSSPLQYKSYVQSCIAWNAQLYNIYLWFIYCLFVSALFLWRYVSMYGRVYIYICISACICMYIHLYVCVCM